MDFTDLTALVEARYRGYLDTRYAFRDADLRAQFSKLLQAGGLSKGPFLESTGVFPKGMPISDFLEQSIAGHVDKAFMSAVGGGRELYAHQEEALRRIALMERNVIVATGTGSGKTEAFLLPILIELYREHLAGTLSEPGVRALIIYPLNALAHDQRSRLGHIARQLENLSCEFSFTYGQYTGETPESMKDSTRSGRTKLDERLPGEVVLREQMRSNPPHILLTNFSMLEYLLLRPADSPLFDGERARSWKFLVLDEAHQYNGSLGIEIGMLVRRLKARLGHAGGADRIRCIGTSATIAATSDDRPLVAEFARSLFGEPFEAEDVVVAEHGAIAQVGTIDLSEQELGQLTEAYENGDSDCIRRILKERLSLQPDEDSSLARMAGTILKADRTASKLRDLLRANPQSEHLLSMTLFPDDPDARRRLSRLTGLLCSAEDPETGVPLAAIRFHYFVRALEGVFLYYSPGNVGWRLSLDRISDTPTAPLFEIALCRECGQHFIVGKRIGRALEEAMHDSGDQEYGAEYYMPIGRESGSLIDWQSQRASLFVLNGITGDLAEIAAIPENVETFELMLVQATASPTHALRATSCPRCGYSATDPIQAVRPGKDGPHVVIATALHEQLPVERRRILAFADSRRDAARFAWFLETSYKSILSRSFILKAIERITASGGERFSLEEVVESLVEFWKSIGAVPESKGNRALVRDAWIEVYREFVSRDRHSSLSSTGQVQWSLNLPKALRAPDVLGRDPWNLTPPEALDVLRAVLGLAREQGAVELREPLGSTVRWDELGMPGPQTSFRIGEGNRRARLTKGAIESWDSARGRRVEYLVKLLAGQSNLERSKASEIAQSAARSIWQSLCEQSTDDNGVLVRLKDSRRLNPDWWRCNATTDSSQVFVCDTCGLIQNVSVGHVCARYGCSGKVVESLVRDIPSNHYAALYASSLPPFMRVEEHTAQIERETARQFQKDFTNGKINVLSSSTTFELGVDLGDLDIVFLRNVPPEIFNYAQRAGRGGRRSGKPGLAITFCNRNPHDLYHYADPGVRLLDGRIHPPIVKIGNKKIVMRHVVAVAISAYLRENPDRFTNVLSLLGDLAAPTLTSRLRDFLSLGRQKIERELKSIVPTDMVRALGIEDGTWVEEACGPASRLSSAEAEISSDFIALVNYRDQSSKSEQFPQAGWAKARLQTIETTDVLSFLSRKAVIPKYGFPVDVVEMDLGMSSTSKMASTVLLQRDLSLAVSEFAPGSRVVANKTEWESKGLKRVIGKEWPVRMFRECRVHGTFESWSVGEQPSSEPCCKYAEMGKYVQPIFGFVGQERELSETSGSQRVFSSRPYFVRMQDENVHREDKGLFSMTQAAPGTMVVLCRGVRGEGFYICSECGAAFDGRRLEHKTPLGVKCTGMLTASSLGHEFVTDVVSLQFKLGSTVPASKSNWYALSLAYALLEGTASALGVPRTNLDATVSNRLESNFPDIILYDDVPGGAGLIAQLRHDAVLRRCFEQARDRVDGRCGCSEDQSCYGCLRNYGNQFAHKHLARGPVLELLNVVLDSLEAT